MKNSWTICAIAPLLIAIVGCGGNVGAGSEEQPEPKPQEAEIPKPEPLPAVDTMLPWPELRFVEPLWVGLAPGDAKRIYVVEQGGKIKSLVDDPKTETTDVLLDLSDKIYRGHNEEGLLALAFHPKFVENRHFFVYYSLKGEDRQRGRRTFTTRFGILSRFTVREDNRLVADRDSEVEILRVDQPWGNHNGAEVVFGQDGMLYMSLGDGGGAGDTENSSQNLGNLLGTVIRIDVDRKEEGRQYAIPKDNPFVERPGARPEIWAYGLRNVWRMSFDADGRLWGGDVGQNKIEEVDLIVKGGNYGWRIMEGTHHFRPDESAPDLIAPIVEYRQTVANGRSITGGFVYPGKAIPGLTGVYVYGDYQSGRIWGLRHKDGKALNNQVLLDSGIRISSFGLDGKGELLICVHSRNGGILKLVKKEAAAAE